MTLELLLDGDPLAFVEEGEEGEAEDEDPPNPVLPVGNEILWAAIFFALLWALMKFVLLPPILAMRTDREEKMRADRDAAERAGDAVTSTRADYESALAGARAEANALIDTARAEADEYKAARQAEADAEIAELRRQAQGEIAEARRQALAQLRGEVSGLAVMAASAVVQSDIDADAAQSAIDRALEER